MTMRLLEFPAMGTTVTAMAATPEGLASTRRWFAEIERCCSRFMPDSALSLVNAAPGAGVRVSDPLAAVLAAAERARRITDGLVDAGVGAAVIGWGYDRSLEGVSGRERAPAALGTAEWSFDGSVLTRAPGTLIDLGGVAKGWACDRAVERGLAAVVSAGGDVRSAHPESEVAVAASDGTVAARVQLGRGALATSSTLRRRWRVGEDEASHLIDPRTMEPVRSPVVSATAVAATAVEAEAAAKAVLLLGSEGLSWAAQRTWVHGALVVWEDGSVYATRDLEVAA